jgi:hypothetical protein
MQNAHETDFMLLGLSRRGHVEAQPVCGGLNELWRPQNSGLTLTKDATLQGASRDHHTPGR